MTKHIVCVSREQAATPALAGSILAKGQQLSNVFTAVVVAQEVQDFFRKADVHDNT